jgi:tRNA(Arg) A34 adenosine deaminase TadA
VGEDEGLAGGGGQAVAAVIVTCPPCIVCRTSAVLDGVDALGFVEWQQLGVPIQNALPDLDADQRELLVTGTHAHCWERLFGGRDE